MKDENKVGSKVYAYNINRNSGSLAVAIGTLSSQHIT